MANLTDDSTFHDSQQTFLAKWLCTTSNIQFTKKGRSYNLLDPSLPQTMNAAMLAMLYGDMITPSTNPVQAVKYNNNNLATRYKCWAEGQARYILGDETQSYVVGYGTDFPTHVQVGCWRSWLSQGCMCTSWVQCSQPQRLRFCGALGMVASVQVPS